MTENAFHGPGAAQSGDHNVQINHYAGPPPRKPRWWLVGGSMAALVVLVTVVIVVSSPGAPERQAAATSSTPAPSSSASAVPAPAVSKTAGPDAIRSTGQVRIAGSGLALDTDPPTVDPSGSEDLILGLVEPPRIASPYMDPTLAEWKGEGMPTRKQCADLVKTQAVGRLTVKVGTVVCVVTNEKRIAVLTITAISNSFSTGEDAQATVWEGKDS